MQIYESGYGKILISMQLNCEGDMNGFECKAP